MKAATVQQAIEEAERFIRAAKEFQRVESIEYQRAFPGTNPREAGAVRRASMDLTRKLADLRLGR